MSALEPYINVGYRYVPGTKISTYSAFRNDGSKRPTYFAYLNLKRGVDSNIYIKVVNIYNPNCWSKIKWINFINQHFLCTFKFLSPSEINLGLRHETAERISGLLGKEITLEFVEYSSDEGRIIKTSKFFKIGKISQLEKLSFDKEMKGTFDEARKVFQRFVNESNEEHRRVSA